MIASWPKKIKSGTSTDHISSFYDVLATLNDVANVKTDFKGDGISFINTLTNSGNQVEHEYLYWEFTGYDGQVAVRMGKWKILWKNIKKGNKKIEVYNLEDDLTEQNNIANEHPEIVKTFFEIIKKEHKTPENKVFSIDPLEQFVLKGEL